MCGFVVQFALAGASAERAVVERMNAAIAHRGPDDDGYHFDGAVGFGFRRLAILDLSPAGHQPMTSADGQVTLVFNGEIYNYAELREELKARGHRFKSSGDSEVLLAAYCEWGEHCLERLNGMWAFVLHDRRSGKLFGSRDRFGIKPLYYHRGTDQVLLASEIKAIRDSGRCPVSANQRVAAAFLLEGRLDDSAETFYEGIVQLPAAHAFTVARDGTWKSWRYWSVEDSPAIDASDPAQAFAELFEDSMRLHMRSDVPVAVHLSGGLDSTAILCAAARLRGARAPALQTFSYVSPEYDESRYIADTLAQTGAESIRLRADPLQLWESAADVIHVQDEPMHSMTPLIGYALMRLTATSGIKVILNGQGADETLAGYPSYFKHYWHGLLSQARIPELWRELGEFTAAHGGDRGAVLATQLRHFMMLHLGRLPGYRSAASRRKRVRARSHPWFVESLTRGLDDGGFDHETPDLNAALARSISRDPLPLYLRIEDRNSMAHSIEARVPFLDHRLVSFAYRLPDRWKLRGQWNKFVLRQGMTGRIPESVRTRVDKMGFPYPAAAWMRGVLREPMLDVLHSRSTRERGIYKLPQIMLDLDRHRDGGVDVSLDLFRIAQYELWAQLRTESRPPTGASSPRRASTVANAVHAS